MTIDDDNSVYVGNLPYDVSDEILHRIFNIYGSISAVKINNDHHSGFRYGFVTFVNPRSSVVAIREMNGQKIYGQAVRVDEVRNKERPDFFRECPRRNFDRGFEDNAWRNPQTDLNSDRQRQRDVHSERFQDYGRGTEKGRYRRYVDLDRPEGDSGHRGDFRKHEPDCERASGFKSMEPKNSSRQKSVDKKGRVSKRERDWERESSPKSGEPRNNDSQKILGMNNHHQIKDHRNVDGAQFEKGPDGDVEKGRVSKRRRHRERKSRSKSGEPRNIDRQKSLDRNNHHQMKDHRYVDGAQIEKGLKGDVEHLLATKRGRHREQERRSTSVETSNISRNHHQMKDQRYVDGGQIEKGPNGDVEQGRVTKCGRHREQESRSTSVETSNSSRQKSVDKNSHHNRSVDGNQFDNGPKGDVDQGRVTKRGSHREQKSRSTSVETSNSSRQKSVDKNSHHRMKDNRSVDGNQFDNGPKTDVEPGRARKRERSLESGSSFSSEVSRDNRRQKSVDTDNQTLSRSPFSDDRSRGHSVESLNDDQDQIETKLASSDQKIVKLREEISRMEDDAADKEEKISHLQEKYQKLDGSSKAATKLTSDRHMQLEKLFKCYLHTKDCEKILKQAEEELQLLVDATIQEFEMEGVLLS